MNYIPELRWLRNLLYSIAYNLKKNYLLIYFRKKRHSFNFLFMTQNFFSNIKYLYNISFFQIIHRDLAARNILITEDHICKVADFGFARDVIASHVYERKSEGRLPIRWMAPESLYDNLFSVKSDVWSFGVLIWEIVTLGSTPYPGMSAAEVMRKVGSYFGLTRL